MNFKKPISALVIIHTLDLQVLLLERAAHPGMWQSVTGSQETDEPLAETARREVEEETGIVAPLDQFIPWRIINRFEIYPQWRNRYANGITHNLEHVFSLCVPIPATPRLAPNEHSSYQWLPWQTAATKCFSWTNQDAILMLPDRAKNKGAGM
ncbi:MAG TPA: dihydroneopterin triphosphate diphosphatase [Rhodocyclaceae bacterium]|nr:dihydroneopterin triphosphate diphosphatase [Rhodocyclaceae bacterium]